MAPGEKTIRKFVVLRHSLTGQVASISLAGLFAKVMTTVQEVTEGFSSWINLLEKISLKSIDEHGE